MSTRRPSTRFRSWPRRAAIALLGATALSAQAAPTFESITLDAASDLLASLDVDHSINLTPGTVYGAVMGNAIHTASGTRIFGDTCATPVDAVPEQQNYALMLAGLGAIGFVARRRRAK